MYKLLPLLLPLAAIGCESKDAEVNIGGGYDTGVNAPGPGGPGGDGWSEQDWCGTMTDLSDLAEDYDPANLRDTIVAISERRYPPAVAFIDVQSDTHLGAWFGGSDQNFDAVLSRYEVAVHEGSHIWDFENFNGSRWPYRVVDDDLIIETAYQDNFYRSAILDRHPYADDDFYADTYLTGQSGSQGFNTLLDEYNAYAHSLASRYCIRDQFSGSTSARDGILTMMLYVELYLQIAREEHPDDYAAILADADTVDMILTVWDRAEYWLDISSVETSLGIDDDFIEGFVYEAGYYAEIQALR